MRALAALLLVACAHAPLDQHEVSAEHVCRPPITIAGNEPRLCWYSDAVWCVYSVGGCDGTYVRRECEAEWEVAWKECRLPSLPEEETSL